MKKVLFGLLLLFSFGIKAQTTFKVDNTPTRFVNKFGIPVKATVVPMGTDSALIWIDPTDSSFNWAYKGQKQKAAKSTWLTWDSIKAKPSNFEYTSNKGIANGYAPIGSDGRISSIYLPFSSAVIKGTWNANTNTPTLSDATGTAGWIYFCNFAGTQNLGSGSVSYVNGDQLVHNGTIWEKVPNPANVNSVNGFTGTIVLTTNNIAEGGTSYYWTSARSRSAMGLTTSGTSGAATYDYVNGIYNIPNYSLAGLGGVAISDTASMLSNYYRTHVAVAALATKLNISDSAAMLLAYKIKDISHDASISALVSDTATLAARFTNQTNLANTKLAIADTASMLSAYRIKDIAQDAAIITKLNISDTASMLSNYYNKTVSDYKYGLKLNLTDSAAMLAAYRLKDISHDASISSLSSSKVNVSDTASMLSPYKAAFIRSSFDTTTRALTLEPISGSVVSVVIPRGSASGATGISALSSSKTGNLVSVAGDNGSQTQFSIQTTDSLTRMHFSDTASMLNAYRLKDISHDASISSLNADTATLTARFANVLAVANAKVNISDTASMLSAYRVKDISHDASIAALNADTATLAARFSNVLGVANAKVNISDTASMLNAYRLKDISTDATLSIKVNYSDTASMLSAYRVKDIAQDASLALKVNYTDTASMMNAYRLKDISHDASISALNADTATLAARFSNVLAVANTKIGISDTASMLSPYARDYNVVHKTGTETIAGAKEFSTVPTSGGNAFVLTNDSRMTNSRNAADVYTWAKQATKPTYDYSELTGTPTIPVVYAWAQAATKPSYTYAEIGGSVPTWNQNTTGSAALNLLLTGGTLTGALNGTSADFSGNVVTGDLYPKGGAIKITNVPFDSQNAGGKIQVLFANAYVDAFSINYLKEATFSGALTGTSATFNGGINQTGTYPSFIQTPTAWASNFILQSGVDITASSTGNYNASIVPTGKGWTWIVGGNGGTSVANLSSTGAATFSSTVTAATQSKILNASGVAQLNIDGSDAYVSALAYMSNGSVKWLMGNNGNTAGNKWSIGAATGLSTWTDYFSLNYSTGDGSFSSNLNVLGQSALGQYDGGAQIPAQATYAVTIGDGPSSSGNSLWVANLSHFEGAVHIGSSARIYSDAISGGSNGWNFGGVTSPGGLTLNTSTYITVNINGTNYKLATVN